MVHVALKVQVLWVDRLSFDEDDRTLDDIFQFTDVARPIVLLGLFDRSLCKFKLARTCEFLQEVVHQEGDVCCALAQRWDVDLQDIDPVEEVFSKEAILDALWKRTVRRG